MKTLVSSLLSLSLLCATQAQSIRVSELPEAPGAAPADLLLMVKNPGASQVTSRITVANLLAAYALPNDVTRLGSAIDLGGDEVSGALPWAKLADVPATFPPAMHAHAQSEVTGLVSDLAGKASVASLSSHTGNVSNPHAVTKAQLNLANVLDIAQEPALGNPSSDRQFLASTVAGVRSWTSDPVGVVIVKSVQEVSFTSPGSTTVFTVPSGRTFIVTGAWAVITSLSGYSSTTVATWRIINSETGAPLTSSATTSSNWNAIGEAATSLQTANASYGPVTGTQPVAVNVVTGSSSTSLVCTAFVAGFYQ